MINLFKKSFNFKTLKSAKGFSLVELMVVVAIIGILATMAIPQVTKFMAKARQAEAKLLLGSIYTAEKGFYVEHSTYYHDFKVLGFSPEGRVRYNGGFVEGSITEDASTAATTDGVKASTSPAFDIDTLCPTEVTEGAICQLMSEGQSYTGHEANSKVDKETFKAYVGSNLIKDATDEWNIDQSKKIEQSSNGLDASAAPAPAP